MKKGFLSLILQLSAMFLMAQTNYYVSADLGTDSGSFGLSPNTPFRSLNYAVDFLEAGDTLDIMQGIYYNDAFGDGDIWRNDKTISINNKNGTPNAYIVIRPHQNQSVVLRGDGLYIFHIRNSSYIRVEGLEIEGEVNNIPLDSALAYQFAYRELGSTEILYRVQPGTPPEVVENLTFEILDNIERPSYYDTKGLVGQLSHHIDIVNNHIHHTPGTGLRFNSSGYMNIIGNEVHDCSRRSYSGTHALVLEACDDMNNSTDTKIWISRNHIHDNYNEIYSWSPSKTIITPIIDEGKGISLQRNDAARGWAYGRIRVENNLTHHNGFSGLHSNTGRGIDFINNTSYYDSRTGNGKNHGISLQNSEDVQIINNIVVNDTNADGYGIAASNSSSNYLVDHNLVWGTVDGDIEAVATNMLYADPLFIDPITVNFGIAEGSPAIDAALPSAAPLVDFTGQPRGDHPDLGAFEFGVSTTISNTPKHEITIYPNPFTDFLTITSTDSIRIFDVLGREVTSLVSLSPNAAMTNIDTSILGKGFYVLVINATSYTLIKN